MTFVSRNLKVIIPLSQTLHVLSFVFKISFFQHTFFNSIVKSSCSFDIYVLYVYNYLHTVCGIKVIEYLNSNLSFYASLL